MSIWDHFFWKWKNTNVYFNSQPFLDRYWKIHSSAWPRRGHMWWGSSNQELSCQHVTGFEEHPFPTQSSADRVSPAEQSHRILVHGRLCQARLFGYPTGVQQHVWAAYSERTVCGQYPSRCALDALPKPRATQPAGGVCPEVKSQVSIVLRNWIAELVLIYLGLFLSTGEVMMCCETSSQQSRSMWSWCGFLPFRGLFTQNLWSDFGKQGTLAGSVSTHSKPSVYAARWDVFPAE